ncbi:MAG: Blue-light-activated protein [Syntrophorhabdus sp. PtaU1.Bin153]|nr:MAG: Blue-light-activated protein [Syntrophorhabdus sp. PtaU1.Bin153]
MVKDKEKKGGGLLGELAEIREQIENFEKSTTYRKLAEIILVEGEQRYRALFEAANDAILLMQDDHIIDCNPKTLEIFGCSKDRVIKRYPEKFFPGFQPDGNPSSALAKKRTGLALAGTPQFFEWRYRRYDGTVFDAEVSLNRVELSGKVFLQAIVRDVTKRKRAEEALQTERENFEALLDQAPFGMVAIGTNGVFKYINPKFKEFFGYDLEDVPNGKEWVKRAYPDPFYRRGVIAAWKQDASNAEARRRMPRTFVVTSKNGAEKIADFMMVGLQTGDYLMTCEDITERKRMADELLKAQKLESIGILAGGVAHDFNNILTVIMGNISLARSCLMGQDVVSQRLAEAEKACIRAKDLTRQLLTFSEGGGAMKKIINLGVIARDTVRQLLRDSTIDYEFFPAHDLFPVEADERQIRQVITNVITNAREAMPSGGTLSVSAENVTSTPKDELPLLERAYVRLSIQDNGSGIPKAYLSRIFDPYFTTKELGNQKGMGLGLAICYSIVNKHKGFIDVQSTVGVGTTVNIYLPACDDEGLGDVFEGTCDLAVKQTILVVDNEKMVRDVMADMLKHLGYGVRCVGEGAEALRLYEGALHSNRPFDAVIMDPGVPGDICGKDAIKRILEIDPGARVICASGHPDHTVMGEPEEHGFQDTVSKPYQINDVAQVLVKVLGSGGPAA